MAQPSPILVGGWLWKKAQNSKLVPRKYQKRWFELTEDALAYAKDPNEVQGSRIEVFSLGGCKWVKRLDECKFEVLFLERNLRLKADTPGDAAKWVYELQKLLHALRQSTPLSSPQAAPSSSYSPQPTPTPQSARAGPTMLTIEADSTDDEVEAMAGAQGAPPKQGGRGPDEDRDSGSGSGASDDPAPSPVRLKPPPNAIQAGRSHAGLVGTTAPNTIASPRRLSPRSMLADPKLRALLSSPHQGDDAAQGSQAFAWNSPRSDAPTDVSSVELPRSAFNTSLRSNVPIQDEAAPALRCGSPGGSGREAGGRRSSNPLLASLPSRSSLRSQRSSNTPQPGAGPGTGPQAVETEEVLVLDDAPGSSAGGDGSAAWSPASTLRTTVSRPASAASRLSATHPPRIALPGPAFGGGGVRATGAAPGHNTRLNSPGSGGRAGVAPGLMGTAPDVVGSVDSNSPTGARAGQPTKAGGEADHGWANDDWDSSSDDGARPIQELERPELVHTSSPPPPPQPPPPPPTVAPTPSPPAPEMSTPQPRPPGETSGGPSPGRRPHPRQRMVSPAAASPSAIHAPDAPPQYASHPAVVRQHVAPPPAPALQARGPVGVAAAQLTHMDGGSSSDWDADDD